MDTLVSPAETNPPTWEVRAVGQGTVVATLHQQADDAFLIEPAGPTIDRIKPGPYPTLEDAMRAIAVVTGGSCVRAEHLG